MVEEGRIARQEAGSLQCPRCGSNNTKFCYFNNYNTAQPRHFCRECHRYWTHGGALRNIPPPGQGNSRKNKRRVITGSSAAPGPTKVPRVHAEATGAAALIMTGPGLAHLGLQPPPPPPPPLFGEGMGLVDSGISLRPTLSLFNQGIVGALRGFQPFNSLMMPHPPPPPPQQQPLPLPLLHGFNMHQVLNVNAGEGSSATRGAADDGAGEGNNSQDCNVGDLFVNQFFTRFGDGEGGDQTKVDFNTGAGDANQSGAATSGAATGSTDAPPPPPPASFI